MTTYTDILYEVNAGVARISINRPEKYNAFRGKTCDELIDALHRAAWNKSIGVVVLTGVREGVLHRRRPEAVCRDPVLSP